jgi:Secretory lipase
MHAANQSFGRRRNPVTVAIVVTLAVWLAAATVMLVSAARAAASTGAGGSRGALVGATRLARLSPATIRRRLSADRIGTRQAQDPVVAYRILYRTVTPSGRPTLASGLIVVPQARTRYLHVIDYEHGTVLRYEAPSTDADSDASLVALLDASAGNLAVAPDYIGMGAGPGRSAYLDVAAETSASVDMLTAARSFAARRGLTVDPRVLVSGFSQGGPAALGLAHALQAGAAPGLRLGGLAAASGVYDLAGAELPAIVAHRLGATITNYNLTMFVLSWRALYHVFGPNRMVFAPGVKPIVHLFTGHHSDEQIFRVLPNTLEAMFRPAFLHQLAHPTGQFAHALATNDGSCRWHPNVAVALYASATDEAVAPLNTRHCAAQLRARGSDVHVISLGQTEHLVSGRIAAAKMLALLTR